MSSLLLYAPVISSRLQYIAGTLFRELLGIDCQLTADKEEFHQAALPKINYSRQRISTAEIFIAAQELLFEKDIHSHDISCFPFEDTVAFFRCDAADLPFDIFAASFFLLSRYEEYLPYQADMHGRYPARSSLAFKHNFLHQPVINYWLRYFRQLLQQRFPALVFPVTAFRFMPTYDIDIAYSYRYKGALRTAGGMIRDALQGEWQDVKTRIKVLQHREADPFDCYDRMDALHRRYGLQPVYFFLAGKYGRYDKNINPRKPVFRQLVRRIVQQYAIGMHPSYGSFLQKEKLQREQQLLAVIAQQPVHRSRQHYIKMQLPESYRLLCSIGITEDYSMGYSRYNGFRAGTCSPYYWYDLQQEKATSLKIFPFCFMEVNAINAGQTPEEALEEKLRLAESISKVNGPMISIWHNNYLGTDRRWQGWGEMYETFVKQCMAIASAVQR